MEKSAEERPPAKRQLQCQAAAAERSGNPLTLLEASEQAKAAAIANTTMQAVAAARAARAAKALAVAKADLAAKKLSRQP